MRAVQFNTIKTGLNCAASGFAEVMDHTRNFVMTQRPAGLFPAIKRASRSGQGTGADELSIWDELGNRFITGVKQLQDCQRPPAFCRISQFPQTRDKTIIVGCEFIGETHSVSLGAVWISKIIVR